MQKMIIEESNLNNIVANALEKSGLLLLAKEINGVENQTRIQGDTGKATNGTGGNGKGTDDSVVGLNRKTYNLLKKNQ